MVDIDQLITELRFNADLTGINIATEEIQKFGSAIQKLNNQRFSISDAIDMSAGKGLKEFQEAMSKGFPGFTDLNQEIKQMGPAWKNGVLSMDQWGQHMKNAVNKTLEKTLPNMKKLQDRTKELATRFDMNILSWVFGGMALQRMGLTIMRFMVPSMDKLEKLNTTGAKKVMGLSAAFEFLKISIFETLANTPLFNQFIEFLIKAFIWISEFAQQHPRIVEMVALLAGVAALLGSFAIGVGFIGQIAHVGKLAWNFAAGIFAVGSFLSALALPVLIVGGIALLLGLTMLLALAFEDTRASMKKIWELGFKSSFESILSALSLLFDQTVSWSDIFHTLAKVGVITFAVIAISIRTIADGISLAIIAVDLFNEGWRVMIGSIRTAALGIQALFTGDFTKFEESWANTTGAAERFKTSISSIGDLMKQSADSKMGLLEIIQNPAGTIGEDQAIDLEEYSNLIGQAEESQNGLFSSQDALMNNLIENMGSIDDPNSVLGRFNGLSNQLVESQAFTDSLSSSIDGLNKEVTVKVNFEYSNPPAGFSGPDLLEGGNISSVTG